MFHYRKAHQRYRSYPKPDGCTFCQNSHQEHAVKTTKYHTIIPNRVMYDVWELRRVVDHLLVIPKRHVGSLGALNDAEKLDHLNLIAEYEAAGYNVYARGVGSLQRSAAHQHTHLIKTGSQQARGSLAWRRPYLFITF